MKNYELIIEQRQPTCGGRAPTKSEIRYVTTDDPVAYVQELEPTCELEVTYNDDGTIASKAFPKSSNEIPRRDPFTPFLVPTRVKYSRAAMLRSICILFSCSIDSNVPRTRLLS